MAATSSSTDQQDAAQAQLTGANIEDRGLTLLATGGANPELDVVFVHGLQGHPEKTWTYKPREQAAESSGKRKSKLSFLGRKGKKGSSDMPASAVVIADESAYWPTALLANDLPTARVFTYGYDSRVSQFFNGPANQNTITDNGRGLLSSIASKREDCLGRPLLLIVHSLGGIVVKSALRISALADKDDEDLKDIYESTFAILFFGTPHRGSDWTDAGLILQKFAGALGFSTSDYNLRALQGNTEILEILRDEFARMLQADAFYITSFQESKGVVGFKGLDAKIVEADSSGLDHVKERKIPVNENHLDMSKFSTQGPTRTEYNDKVRSEIRRHWKRESIRLRNIQTNPSSDALLQSLESDELSHRFKQVEQAQSETFEWLFAKPEIGFQTWLESGKGLYWIRGHPASGKSTLLKWIYKDQRTNDALAAYGSSLIKANFFFHNRGSELQKTFKGLLQSILSQILYNAPQLLTLISPIYHDILRRFDKSWTEDDLYAAFQSISTQSVEDLDIILFLDALDEYEGDYTSMARFLSSISNETKSSSTRIKICFSSRTTIQIFVDLFEAMPGFHIHEHTADDIKIVIRSRMLENPRMSEYMSSANAGQRELTQEFATKIFDSAEGIFLWVVLVLDELLEEFTEGESLPELIKKIEILPPNLEEFYEHIVTRIPSNYAAETKVIFQVLLHALHPPSLHDLFKICQYSKIEKLVDCPSCTSANFEWDEDSIIRWVRSRTGGLVQIVPLLDPSSRTYSTGMEFRCSELIGIHTEVQCDGAQFLHQTVKSFCQRATWTMELGETRYPAHQGAAYIARYILALLLQYRPYVPAKDLKAPQARDTHGESQLFEPLCSYMYLAEMHKPKILLPTLLEFGDKRIYDLYSGGPWMDEMGYTPLTNLADLAVVFGLSETLDELLKQEGRLTNDQPSALPQRTKRSIPLLHLAIKAVPPSRWSTYTPPAVTAQYSSVTIASLVRVLFSHGADANQSFDGTTAYGLLCQNIAKGHYRHNGPSEAIILAFLENGQSPDLKISYRFRIAKRHYRSFSRRLLHCAAEQMDTELMSTLLQHGADVNVLDDAGSTPLDCLCDGERGYQGQQLAELISAAVLEPVEVEDMQQRIDAAYLLISRGGKFGIPSHDANQRFKLDRIPITERLVEQARQIGLDVDDRLVWAPRNQISQGISATVLRQWERLKGFGSSH